MRYRRNIWNRGKEFCKNNKLPPHVPRIKNMLYEERMEGKSEGMREGMRAFVEDYLEEGRAPEVIMEKLVRRFGLSYEEAQEYVNDRLASMA